jgi:fructan beta-fructosidase
MIYLRWIPILSVMLVLAAACAGPTADRGQQPSTLPEATIPARPMPLITPIDRAAPTAAAVADLRPRFHFTPPAGWINDPNGLVYLDGEYHLFYQHNPDALVWGPMHWGHAVSRDLIHWENLPIALVPDALGAIFSGSAVIDQHNSAGFGAGAMVAIFTHASDKSQAQSLAYSTDRGRTWRKYAGNPVLAPPPGQRDFRDPKVFWYGDAASDGHWVMVLAVGHSIWFYRSPNLKTWTKISEFGDAGAQGGIWETPDLLKLPIDGSSEAAWVLAVSVQSGAPAGGSGVQYFVGDFDGSLFQSTSGADAVDWADYGGDFYAAQSWNNTPDGRALWLAWMNNWSYADAIPADGGWRGSMTLARELALAREGADLVLIQRPPAELARLRGTGRSWANETISGASTLLADVRGTTMEISATFRVDDSTTATRFGLKVRVGEDEATTIGYNRQQSRLYLDRSHAGGQVPGFGAPQVVALQLRDGQIELHILVDTGSLEVFADGGRTVLTDQIIPSRDSNGLQLFADDGTVVLERLTVVPLGTR